MHIDVSHGTEFLPAGTTRLAIAGPLFHFTILLVTLALSILTFRPSELLPIQHEKEHR